MRTLAVLVVAFYILSNFFVGDVRAMSSASYGINWDSINSGGDDVSSSTNFGMHDTIGEQATGVGTSTNFQISAGYRVGDDVQSTLSFSIGTQENGTETAYTAFSSAGKSVDVVSTASYSVGDFIVVVENVGLSQNIAVGRVVTIVGATMTVDAWDGVPGTLAPTPSGGNDFVYRLGGSAASLGTLSAATGKTSVTATRVSSNAPNGYTVYVSDDGNLRVSPGVFIANVADGSVTIGSEEYGWEAVGTTATSTSSDHAFATSTQAIQESSSPGGEDRIGLIYKVAISSTTVAGSYSQAVYYTMTPNY